MMMPLNKIDRTISPPAPVTKCGQPDTILARQKRTELQRIKDPSSSSPNDCVPKKRRPVTKANMDREVVHQTSVIGRRREMQDAVSVVAGFVNEKGMKFDFYGVYDGHGGSGVANVCGERLYKLVAAEMVAGNEVKWEEVMVESFGKMDEEVDESELKGYVGSTAVVAVVGENEIVVANCGDSRAVLYRGGVAMPLSDDHKPDRPDELKRIEQSGGTVVDYYGRRVLGVLATSRSIGDRDLKPYVIANPDVIVKKREDDDEFMILASDGLWDVISNDIACHAVKKCLQGRIIWPRGPDEKKRRMMNATLVLTELAMARGSNDNISVIVVNLKARTRNDDDVTRPEST